LSCSGRHRRHGLCAIKEAAAGTRRGDRRAHIIREMSVGYGNWKEIFELVRVSDFFDKWMNENHYQFYRHSSRTVNQANRLLAQGRPKYPDKLRYSYVRFACKHYGTYRSSTTGTRPNQR